MKQTVLGRTGLKVSKEAFGALPIQRAAMPEAVKLLGKALDGGINFFDTARGYSDSEEKIGNALSARRGEFFLATKTPSRTVEGFWKDLETSLKTLKMDHIDVYQFHNPTFVPKPGDGKGLYEAMVEARSQGKIRFIGITNHRLALAREAVESGLYDTLQFPFSYLSNDEEIALTRLCGEKGVGFIAMKALSGGLITDINAAQAWMGQLANVVPIWGIQRETELEALLGAAARNSGLLPEHQRRIDQDRQELSGAFCRGCGYCLPCPAEIKIDMLARLPMVLRRMPSARFFTDEWRQEVAKITNCLHCNHCKDHCPYGLDTPALLENSYRDYQSFPQEGKPISAA